MYLKIEFDEIKNNIKSFDLLYSTTTTRFSRLINKGHKIMNGIGGTFSHVGIIMKGDIFPINAIIKSTKKEYKDYMIDPEKFYIFESIHTTQSECPSVTGCHIDGVQLRDFDEVLKSYFKLKNDGSMEIIGIAKLNNIARKKVDDMFKKIYSFDDNEHYDTQIKNNIYEFIQTQIKKKYNFSYIDQLYMPFHKYRLIQFIKNIKDYFYKYNDDLLCSELVGTILIKLGLLDNNINIHYIMPESFLPKSDNETYDHTKQLPVLYENPIEIINTKYIVSLVLDDIIKNVIKKFEI